MTLIIVAMASASFLTIGRFSPAPIDMIMPCGSLMIDAKLLIPIMPMLESENVPPWYSSGFNFFFDGVREFHALVRAVGKVTGREMVLDTSFNVKGQPIVNTPREAIDTFLGTGIEFLFLENTLLRRPGAK